LRTRFVLRQAFRARSRQQEAGGFVQANKQPPNHARPCTRQIDFVSQKKELQYHSIPTAQLTM
jgi:hypothetical protein